MSRGEVSDDLAAILYAAWRYEAASRAWSSEKLETGHVLGARPRDRADVQAAYNALTAAVGVAARHRGTSFAAVIVKVQRRAQRDLSREHTQDCIEVLGRGCRCFEEDPE